ncbi:hypothetical protein COT87_01275 [Candidatus Collierbacteria bacterium CG10_big_fil_rev_8_21_14_0_10_44_9]|uniref:AAA+ ATPase domain-containing protein n=1 Tax=Candidatus Collierbacteria bacterium CG10_big_fil_rev_8_21_14_0_10_44_9 TaxID=1974535 RepID=A0A2H0VJ19_9BACT|nr:MAG: hypothetical protein COT87_01275 [Candidatus Collierbacteria bacterium CG10_big_fil_rev_8_21_14_0_10_44_9]
MKSFEQLRQLGLLKKGTEFVYENYPTPTGIQDLDVLLGGGWEPGINVIAGISGTGKSLICATTMANQLSQGKPVLVVDTEGSFDLWQNHLDLSEAWVLPRQQNTFLPFGFDYAITVQRIAEYIQVAEADGAQIGAIIIDSLDAMMPRGEQSPYSTHTMDITEKHAREIEQFLQILHQLGLSHQCPVLLTHHNTESPTSFMDQPASHYHLEEYDHPIMTESERNVQIALDVYSSTYITTFPLYQFPGNNSLQNTPFIAPGRSAGRSRVQIDFEHPDRFVIGTSIIKAKRQTTRENVPVSISFATLLNFNYSVPTGPRYDMHRALALGFGDPESEPDETALNVDQEIVPNWEETESEWNKPSNTYNQQLTWE